MQDITDRKLVELERNASEERLDMALRAGRMVAWDRDVATGIVTRSRNADAIIGNRVEHASDYGVVVGFEALARWDHPDRGILTPQVFGAVFEDGRLASAVGRRMLDRVFRDLKDWIERDLPVGRIALNFSSFEFRTPDLAQSVLERLRVSGIDNRHFEVEVVETVLLDRNTDGIIKTLKHFHDQGVKISLDDFGTGYASLIHLKRFPVDEIKLDRSFIVEMESGKNLALIAGVIQLGKSLGLTTVAEGMETRDQAEMLRAAGCDVGQGRLFSRPMAARDVPSFLTQAGRSREMESEVSYTSAA